MLIFYSTRRLNQQIIKMNKNKPSTEQENDVKLMKVVLTRKLNMATLSVLQDLLRRPPTLLCQRTLISVLGCPSVFHHHLVHQCLNSCFVREGYQTPLEV